MKFMPTNERNVLSIAAAENCDTDSLPFVQQVFFRRYQSSFDPEMGAVATAILFAGHCGAVVEFGGAKVGIDAARAIRTIVPDVEEILPLDGMKREIGQGGSSIVVGDADRILGGAVARDGIARSSRIVTWSGDFIGAGERNSSRHIAGDIFTNALLVATSTSISVAIALLVAGRGLRDIFVPKPEKNDAAEFRRLAKGLDFVGIKLRAI